MKPSPGLRSGVCYFYVHFITEVVCFYTLGHLLSDTASTWIIPLTFDMLAFVPQSLIGALSDRKKQLPLGVIGVSLMAITAGLLGVVQNPYILLLPLCLGNACTHVAGAQATLRCAEGKLAPSAIFVAGGSFGVITGRLLSVSPYRRWRSCCLHSRQCRSSLRRVRIGCVPTRSPTSRARRSAAAIPTEARFG